MIKDYGWRDLRNAVGWAAACARLALEFYVGDRPADVIAAIEIAERYAAGGEISASAASAATATAASSHAAANAAASTAASAASAARAYAAYAAYAAARCAAYAADAASAAAHAAARAGVPQEAIDQVQLSSIAVDLGLVADSDSYFAAIAALAIGDIAWAREIAETSECT